MTDVLPLAKSRVGSRSRWAWGFALLAVGLTASLFWTVHPWYDPTNDGAMYILTGRSIASGDGYSMLGIPFRIRPPGFSALIAPILAWRGTDFLALNLFVSLWGVAGALFLFLFARGRIGDALAFLVSLAVWLNPGYQRLCNQPLSDIPGFALLFGLLWIERRLASRLDARRALFLGLGIGLSAYVRSALLLLVPAIGFAWLFARASLGLGWKAWSRAVASLVLGVLLAQAPWSLRNRLLEPSGAADQVLLHSYSTAMWHADMGDPDSRRLSLGEVFGRVRDQGPKLVGALGSRMGKRARGYGPLLSAGVLVGCTLVLLFRRREAAEFFALLSLAVIAFYFGFAQRLVMPVYALVLLATVELVRDAANFVSSRLLARKLGTGVACAGLLAWTAIDFGPRRDWPGIEAEHLLIEEISARFKKRLSPADVPASVRGWHYAVFLDRPVYSLEFAAGRAGRMDATEDLIDKYRIDTVLLSPRVIVDLPYLEYFEARYGDEVADPFARVYRVRPRPPGR